MAALLAEAVVRIAAPQQLVVHHPELWRPSDSVGYSHAPNVRLTMNTGDRTVTVVTDADGYRIGVAKKPVAETRILLIGDSLMEALQVEYEQSLAGLLEERLPHLLDRSVAVTNTGVSGWQPSRYLAQARVELARRRYDLLLVSIFLGNDIEERRLADLHEGVDTGAANAPTPPHRHWLVDNLLVPVNESLRQHSHLFVLLKDRSRSLLARVGLRELDIPIYYWRSEASSRWDITATICRDIAAEAAEHGVPTLFMLIPPHFEVDTTLFQRYLESYQVDAHTIDLDQPARLLGTALRAQGLDVVDVVPALRAAHASGIQCYGTVDKHLSPAGHDVVERTVEQPVVDALRVGSRS